MPVSAYIQKKRGIPAQADYHAKYECNRSRYIGLYDDAKSSAIVDSPILPRGFSSFN